MTSRQSLTPADRSQLDALVRSMGPRLLGYARRVLGSDDVAEDVVAETFCRAAENIASLRAADRPDLYLIAVVRNLCRDRWRRRQPDNLPDERLDRWADDTRAPDGAVTEVEELAALRQAVDALPPTLREIVVLRVSVGLTFEEASKLLQIPLGTALSRMHAATLKLREVLESKNVG